MPSNSWKQLSFFFKEVTIMEFIRRHKRLWAIAALATTIIVILFTIFGGAEEEEVGMYGKVETKRVYLSFNMEFPIKEMHVQEGDFVHKGDVLGTLSMEEMVEQVAAEKKLLSYYEAELKGDSLDGDGRKLAYSRLSGLRADLLLKEKFLRQAQIVAPNDGTISQRLQNPGEMAVAMKPVYYLEMPNSKWVRAYASEEYAKKISRGMPVTIVAEVMPETTAEGRIYYVSTVATPLPEDIAKLSGAESGYEVRVAVKDGQDILQVGHTVEVVVK